MRVTKQVMAENNAKIVNEASILIREKGIEATSVSDVMGAAGLTHGGFYRHFASKEELVNAAIDKSSDSMSSDLELDISQRGAVPAITDFVSMYLSKQHVSDPGSGCIIAALSAEVDRGSKAHKERITKASEHLVKVFSSAFIGSQKGKLTKAAGLLAILVGTLVLARSTTNPRFLEDVLASGAQLAKSLIEEIS